MERVVEGDEGSISRNFYAKVSAEIESTWRDRKLEDSKVSDQHWSYILS